MYHFDKIVSRETYVYPNDKKHSFVYQEIRLEEILDQSSIYLEGFA